MIFSKEKYFSHGIASTFIERIKLMFTLSLNYFYSTKSSAYELPYCAKNLGSEDTEELNLLCHTKAFSFKDGACMLEISKCDSCGDCTSFTKENITLLKKDVLSNNLKIIELHR